jgi:hypothetical protein
MTLSMKRLPTIEQLRYHVVSPKAIIKRISHHVTALEHGPGEIVVSPVSCQPTKNSIRVLAGTLIVHIPVERQHEASHLRLSCAA